MLICPVCDKNIDPDGPGVGSHPMDDRVLEGGWKGYWIPFIYDLRGSPRRLVHAECYAVEHGVSALVALFHRTDETRRAQGCHHGS
ncbi:hypothetical protein Pmi06nite_74300 [Planotetraspora mira]|uniref:Uncharacterized protein n=1 Tax=Planotetraspora mira TaxID=58121 RepID=A0A8J3TWR7_9ACTN|nr:hypothetical protein Pmi06nite_74300 [Planotetraspora mira]